MAAVRAICVCVPVRNEAALLPALLAALAAQVGVPGATMSAALLFDGCTDASEDIVRAAALPFAVATARLPRHAEPNAGRARAAAMALGARATAEAGPALLLSTDADSVPAPDWIVANARALARADVVAGRIVRAPLDAASARLEAYYDRLHALRRRLDPVPWEASPAHHFTSGASLGFRADAHAALGGFASLASGEDGEIVDRAQRAGLRVRRDPAVVVATSSRRDGRAPGGVAAMLRRIDEGAEVARVAHPAGAAWQYRAHAAARAAFARPGDLAALARAIGGDAAALRRLAADVPNAEAFATLAVPAPPGGEHLVPLDEAGAALELIEAGVEERAA